MKQADEPVARCGVEATGIQLLGQNEERLGVALKILYVKNGLRRW